MPKSLVRCQVALIAALAIHALVAAPAEAVPFQNSTGIAAPTLTITFSEFGIVADTVITDQYSTQGVTFSPNLYQNPQLFPNPHIDPGPDSLSNFSGDAVVPVFSIHFNTVLTEAAFAMITNPGTSMFEALLLGIVVDSGSLPTRFDEMDNFYGFTGVAFDEIRVTVGGGGNAMILDNLQLGTAAAIPEPSSLLLMLSGSAVGVLAHRVRRKA